MDETLDISGPEPIEQPSEQVEAQVEEQTDKPEGWDQVEFSPEQQKRFDRVYRQTKDLQRAVSERDQILRQQFDLINQLKEGQQQIVSHIQKDEYSRQEAQLSAQRDEAFERGDIKAYNEATDKLYDIRFNRMLKDQQAEKEQKTQPQEQIQEGPISGNDAVQMAVDDGEISPQDGAIYRNWANEKDQYGNYLRPWVHQDLRNSPAAFEGRAVFENPAYANKSFAWKLQEIDRRMGVQARQPSQAVMPGASNLTRGTKLSNIKLSPFQEQIAIKTKFAGPGKTNADHLEAYRKQVSEVKGARR